MTLALLASLDAGAQTSMSDERRAQLLARMEQTVELKIQARDMRDTFLKNVSENPRYDLAAVQRGLAEVAATAVTVEARERGRRDWLLSILAKELSAGRLTRAEHDRRAAAVEKIFQIRFLYVYGFLFPGIIDESISDGAVRGRDLAGPSWEMVITRDEVAALHDEYRAACGFTPDMTDNSFPPAAP